MHHDHDEHITDDELLTPEQALAILNIPGLTTARLALMRTRGQGPVYYVIGRSIFYARTDVKNWLENCRRTPANTTDNAINSAYSVFKAAEAADVKNDNTAPKFTQENNG